MSPGNDGRTTDHTTHLSRLAQTVQVRIPVPGDGNEATARGEGLRTPQWGIGSAVVLSSLRLFLPAAAIPLLGCAAAVTALVTVVPWIGLAGGH